MPDDRVFLDSNTLLYMHDRSEPEKSALATEWIRAVARRQIAQTNLQVLNEVTHVLLRKRWFESPRVAHAIVDQLAELGDSQVGWTEIAIARNLFDRFGYSWWDCLLLASAIELGCTHFLSEDMQDGQRIETGKQALTIVDPFAHTPEQILTPS